MTNLNIEDLARLDLLLSIDGIGPGKVRNLLSKFHSLESIFSANYNTLLEVDGISNNLAQRIHQSCKLLLQKITEIKIELEKLDKLNASIITVWDKEYPPILKKFMTLL